MERGPKFSVLLASFNNAGYIDEALKSVMDQTYTNWEVIIVDDASVDETKEVLKKYRTDKRIKVVYRSGNLGCGATKRETVTHAEGQLAGFLDPDDKLAKNALELMVKKHLENPEASLVYSLFYACDENLENPSIPDWIGPLPENELNLKANKVSHFASFKVDLYRQTDGIDPRLKRAVDKDLYYRLEEVGAIDFINLPLYHYRIHSGGIASTKSKKIKALRWAFYVKKSAYLRREQKGQENIRLADLKKDFKYLNKKECLFYLKKGNWKLSLKSFLHFFHPGKSAMFNFDLPE